MLRQEKKSTGIIPAGKKDTVLIIDKESQLKLARWRLHGDGHRVVYLNRDPDRQMILKENPDLVLLNITEPVEGVETFATLQEKFPALRMMLVVDAAMAPMMRTAQNMGAAGILTRPVDYPVLSAVVREQLQVQPAIAREERLYRKITRRFRLGPGREQTCWKNIMDTLKTGVILVNVDGDIEHINSTAVEWLECNQDGSGMTYRGLLQTSAHPLGDKLTRILDNALEEGQLVHAEEYLNFEISSYLLYNETKEIDKAFVIIDQTEILNKDGLGMANTEKLAMVGQLAAGAAHEIRNPLTSVRGFIQLLQKEFRNTPKAEYIEIIISEIDRVNVIINEFLKMARPSTPRRLACKVEDLFREMRVLFESDAFIKKVEVIEEFDEIPEVFLDKEQIKQVLINIIQNSFDAMPMGGKLKIKVAVVTGEDAVVISISDSGSGMDREIVDSMFKPFYTTKENGTGLGMSVSLQIIKNHGGRIEIDSAPGQGTTTNIYLPAGSGGEKK